MPGRDDFGSPGDALARMFRDIVVTRLVYPVSKLKTVDYLYRYQGKTVLPDQVYRFLCERSCMYAITVWAADRLLPGALSAWT